VTIAALRDLLGGDYRSEPLKSIGLRVRNALKPWPIRQPQRAMSELVTAPDGRRFKLLAFGASIADKHRQVEERLNTLAPLDCVPSLVWRDDRHLLVDWVEGETPHAHDPAFASALGAALAALYRVGLAWRVRAEVVSALRTEIRPLVESGRLSPALETALDARLSDTLPETVPTAMLCGDPTLANFVLGADGRLSMIDPGSFVPGLPIDVFLSGGDLYDAIDRDAFHDAYAHAQGIDFPFEHRDPLRLFFLARQSALQSRLLDSTPRLEAKRRRNQTKSLESLLTRLREALER
jgi:hypothetical protein